MVCVIFNFQTRSSSGKDTAKTKGVLFITQIMINVRAYRGAEKGNAKIWTAELSYCKRNPENILDICKVQCYTLKKFNILNR